MSASPLTVAVLSDFNVANLAGLLENGTAPPAVRVVMAPFGLGVRAIVDREMDLWREPVDVVVAWTRPEAVIEPFARVLGHERVASSDLLAAVDAWVEGLASLKDRARAVLVPTWVSSPNNRGLGLLDMKSGFGAGRALLEMNARLAEGCEQRGLHVLNGERWIAAAAGKGPAFSPKLWYSAKIPFSHEVHRLATSDIKSGLTAIFGGARKIVLVDLDNTLWGGVLGDDGIDGIVLGGHDASGEAFVEFQRELKALTRAGVLLGIISKNEEGTALAAIENHPEMVLRKRDFVGWRINWSDKAANIIELVEELGLLPQSCIFIDDSPVERDRVRSALPDVLVPEWPTEAVLFKDALRALPYLESAGLTDDDVGRAQKYVVEQDRRHSQKSATSLDDWVESLELHVVIERLSAANLTRAVQLLNKTNQLNLATRRMTEEQLLAWTREPGHAFWTVRVGDRFGDYGLTGALGLALGGGAQGVANVTDYVLSCRVMGRRVEETMVEFAVTQAVRTGATELVARYLPTEKNGPCFTALTRAGLPFRDDSQSFHWPTKEPFPVARGVVVEVVDVAEVKR